jgi:hypothetical protein
VRASADLDAGSATYVMIIRPGSAGSYAVIGEGDVADHRMVEVPGTGFIASATAGG